MLLAFLAKATIGTIWFSAKPNGPRDGKVNSATRALGMFIAHSIASSSDELKLEDRYRPTSAYLPSQGLFSARIAATLAGMTCGSSTPQISPCGADKFAPSGAARP